MLESPTSIHLRAAARCTGGKAEKNKNERNDNNNNKK